MKPIVFLLTSLMFLLILINGSQAQDLAHNFAMGKVLYQTHCLRCHGPLGDGKGPDATTLIVPPRDFHSSASTAKTERELRSIIIWGLVFSPMHGWWDRLKPEEIRAVVGYIRRLAPYQPRI